MEGIIDPTGKGTDYYLPNMSVLIKKNHLARMLIIVCSYFHSHTWSKSYKLFKQFVVTNCSKERPGSIVNETLKNGISMLKDISKESDFYADFKYISFIEFSLCHQKFRA